MIKLRIVNAAPHIPVNKKEMAKRFCHIGSKSIRQPRGYLAFGHAIQSKRFCKALGKYCLTILTDYLVNLAIRLSAIRLKSIKYIYIYTYISIINILS